MEKAKVSATELGPAAPEARRLAFPRSDRAKQPARLESIGGVRNPNLETDPGIAEPG
jgi:hypothetical protein